MARYRTNTSINAELSNFYSQDDFDILENDIFIPKIVVLRFTFYNLYHSKLQDLIKQFDDNSDMFVYLINKYINKFKILSERKKSSKKIYQIVCKKYLQISMRVNLTIHQMLKDISDMTGYSISYVIRLMIEWEMDELNSQDSQVNNELQQQSDTFFRTIVKNIKIDHKFDVLNEIVAEIISIEYG